MKEKIQKSIEILKSGKNISEKEKVKNQKESKTKSITMYIIPLILLIITAIAYILLQNNILLIVFGILMFIVLWGWDSASRTCPNCKKWNSTIWENSKRLERETSVKKKSILKKEQSKKVIEKYTKLEGKCKNCNCKFEIEKGRII